MKTSRPSLYRIEETPCFPCAFKIVPVALAGECWRGSNETHLYFRTREAARAEIVKRGAREVK